MTDATISLLDHFPLPSPRPGQVQSMDFIERMVADGCQDIVIEAPTGAGKSALGAACCHWAANWPMVQNTEGTLSVQRGGYYLVTQKALQDQITKDVRLNFGNKDFCSLKSSEAYPCDRHVNCQVGLRVRSPHICEGREVQCCPYLQTKTAFQSASFSITNYAYFLTERLYVGAFPARHILVCDECHTIERNLLKFGELVVSDRMFREWGIRSIHVPEYERMATYVEWLGKVYLPLIKERLKELEALAEISPEDAKSPSFQASMTALSNQEQKVSLCMSETVRSPEDWVYWCDETEKDGRVVYLKPLNAAPYMDLIRSGGSIRIYMSAYPGDRELFCRSLGLDKSAVAWIKLPSAFKPENRPIIIGSLGSMSKKNLASTLPPFLRVVDKIFTTHNDEKGIIHCNSYALGKQIVDHFMRTPHAPRILFPKSAEERDAKKLVHETSPEPTVLVSPSMTEGYDFKDDLARWQIIAKMPYPYLGDQQVAAKKDRDPDWYALQTAMTVIQACGRIVRSETDHGVTYILDADFNLLWDRYKRFFPPWFQAAMQWPGKPA